MEILIGNCENCDKESQLEYSIEYNMLLCKECIGDELTYAPQEIWDL